ncbi:tetratricopeptide repeat-containing hybrid sensor histidine kinase/response regulator [Winogradskyella haliclonae]|uniref:histidine kinase n=1 Tax=Winogradskyella haliclonae TaxID=2048558 RepID=A0ABQ2BWG2_9FLAO|nr:ATP-binding protein [Winogradskyella haliclonae]GGI56807.1 histidine kinase [Winogradskyella haliclonae]
MSQTKLYIFLFFIVFGVTNQAQTTDELDIGELEISLQQQLDQAKLLTTRGDYYNAKDNLEKALDISIKINDRKSEGVIHTKIAKLQYLIEEPEQAISSLTKAINIQRTINDKTNLGLTYNIRGVIHSNLKQYKTALEYYSNALNSFEDESSEKYEAEVNLNEARVYNKLGQPEKAHEKLERAIIIANKYELNRVLSSSYILNANVYQSKEEYNLALDQAQTGLDIAQENNSTENLNNAYLTLSKIYQSKKQYKSANLYLNKHIQLSDSLLNIQRENLSTEKSTQHIVDYQNAENQQLKDQITEADVGSNLARITTILSISLITILSLLTLSLYKNNNIRLRTNNMLQIKNDELIVAKEKAELASKTKANFLSTVTHELRTPLYAVTGLTNLLLDEEPKEKQIPHLKSLKFSGDYLLTFINDILQINKIEANKVELDPEDFNLKTKIENVIAALNNSAKDNNTKIHFDYEENLPETYIGDQLKISQILINLLGNAIKFTKDGDIWVRVKKAEVKKNLYQINFEIQDNGIGISKEKQEQMFESFSQGSIQINRKYGGTGLGLSIVKGLIKILEGKIYLKSQLGKGTSFFFELPLKHVEPKKKAIVKESKHIENIKALDLENIKILVVEDNKINQMITKKILTKMGLGCDIVDNGEEAVNMVKNTEYNVVLMDIHMPGISGLEATRRIRVFNKELTIFALTAVTLEDKMHEFDEAGFDDIISKPFKQETFEKKLYTALSGKSEATA